MTDGSEPEMTDAESSADPVADAAAEAGDGGLRGLFRRRSVRVAIAVAAIPVLALLVVMVEVEIARRGTNLDDIEGARPVDMVFGQGPELRLVWLGDSTSTGVGSPAIVDAVAGGIADELAAGTASAVSLTVLGVSGAVVAEVVDEQLPGLGDARPDIIIISAGANDVTHLTSLGGVRGSYRTLLEGVTAAAPDATVMSLGVPAMGTVPRFLQPLRAIAGIRAGQIDGEVRGAAADAEVLYVPIAELTGDTFASDPDRYFAADGFHPSSDGYAVWTQAIVSTPAWATMLAEANAKLAR